MRTIIRPILPEDADELARIGTVNYPAEYEESSAAFRSKIAGYPAGCWAAEVAGQLAGYVVSFPYQLNHVFPINTRYTQVGTPDCYYVHDLCVNRNWRGLGIATQLATAALAHGWPVTALVAVLDSRPFWEKLGFVRVRELEYCGRPATYMTRRSE